MTELQRFLRKISFKHRNEPTQGITVRTGKIVRVDGKLISVCAECPCPEFCKDVGCS